MTHAGHQTQHSCLGFEYHTGCGPTLWWILFIVYLAEINLQFIPLSIFDKLWFYRSGRDLDNTVSSKLDDLAKKKKGVNLPTEEMILLKKVITILFKGEK